MSKSFKLGADPEMFLVDAAGGLISSIGRIGGTKEEPKPLPIGDGFAVQEDNVAVEFNIPASDSAQQFSGNLNRALSYLSDLVAEQGLKLVNLASASFPKEQLMSPAARVFGCDPDFCAWNFGRPNPRPKATDSSLRSCGGHVHIGYQFETQEDIWQFIKYLDLYLSVPSTIMDKDEKRKQLYGKWGAFRYKPYGCEYRSLSNYWVMEDKGQWVWNQVELALDAWQNNKDAIDEDKELLEMAINQNNKVIADKLIQKHNLILV